MRYSAGWASHLPVLIKILQGSEGPVLEIGSGVFSTPVMHWLCQESKRQLVTYENVPEYYNMNKAFRSGLHEIVLVEDWDQMPIENQHWGVALIDHNPVERRKIEAARLASIADYVILHDTEPHMDIETGYIKETFPLYKHHYMHKRQRPYTSVVSNFIDPLTIL
jgi:hypothetical protein